MKVRWVLVVAVLVAAAAPASAQLPCGVASPCPTATPTPDPTPSPTATPVPTPTEPVTLTAPSACVGQRTRGLAPLVLDGDHYVPGVSYDVEVFNPDGNQIGGVTGPAGPDGHLRLAVQHADFYGGRARYLAEVRTVGVAPEDPALASAGFTAAKRAFSIAEAPQNAKSTVVSAWGLPAHARLWVNWRRHGREYRRRRFGRVNGACGTVERRLPIDHPWSRKWGAYDISVSTHPRFKRCDRDTGWVTLAVGPQDGPDGQHTGRLQRDFTRMDDPPGC